MPYRHHAVPPTDDTDEIVLCEHTGSLKEFYADMAALREEARRERADRLREEPS